MRRFIVVTGADEAYAEFAADLAQSLAPFRAQLEIDVGLLDFGLDRLTRAALAGSFNWVIGASWPFRPHARFDSSVRGLAMAARPFLPDLFPGYDAYAWIDADSFVQDVRGLILLMAAARDGLAGVVPTVDRSYTHPQSSRDWIYRHYRAAFDEATTQRLMTVPYVGSGVVGAAADSPLWRLWRERFQIALDRWEGDEINDQAILNHVVWLENLPHHRLPSLCNWNSHLALPLADVARGALVEPSYPHDPIYIVANSVVDKNATQRLRRTDGGSIRCKLTLTSVRQALKEARGAAT